MTRPHPARRLAVLAAASTAALVAATLTGCGTPSRDSVTVFAAASLTESFTTLAHRFEAAHPGTTVVLNFGGSSALATQVTQGAPADVFASASATTMDQVVAAGAAAAPTTFARNVMEIAVPRDNPAHVAGLSDLARPGVAVAVCQSEVPCGATAEKVLAAAHLTVHPVTRERDVKSALAKVELGEVDAALVYVTDVRAAGDAVTGVTVPDAVNASTSYPIAALTHAKHPALARDFVDYVLSADGRAVLAAAGFTAP